MLSTTRPYSCKYERSERIDVERVAGSPNVSPPKAGVHEGDGEWIKHHRFYVPENLSDNVELLFRKRKGGNDEHIWFEVTP